jgi:hypothetical protein
MINLQEINNFHSAAWKSNDGKNMVCLMEGCQLLHLVGFTTRDEKERRNNNIIMISPLHPGKTPLWTVYSFNS